MMGESFTSLDLVIFFAALVGVMAVGLIAARKEETAEDYFLAGRGIRWWGVAGSIFGSNVSANHMVGMMGLGFSVGFAQSHFELGAIFGLMALCYGFLPVYRRLRVYTLSEYLGRRYDDRSRLAYALIMVTLMAVVQMVPGLYIGARSMCLLMEGAAVEVVVDEAPELADDAAEPGAAALATKRNVNRWYYSAFIIALAVVAAGYTILGGLKAVVWTDVIQTVLMLLAGIAVAVLTFMKIGGWGAMMALDAAGSEKMRLYRPMNDPDLPWTGVLTGLMAMHCFYWGTNQFIVQRALGARSDREARLGIIAAGFLKLLIPFFAIASGVAAFYLFQEEFPNQTIDPDAAFSELVKLVILPIGPGIIGLIAAGLIGAILSSIDSMMNSAATIVTIDFYQRYVNPQATDRQMIRVGRWSIVAFVTLAAGLAIAVMNPNSEKNFFLQIADYSNYLTPGILVAFLLGMFWRRATATSAIVTIVAGVLFSVLVQWGYGSFLGTDPAVAAWLGEKLSFFHRVVFVIGLCVVVQVTVSLLDKPDREKGRLVWIDLGGHAPADLVRLLGAVGFSLGLFAVLGIAMVAGWLSPTAAGVLAALWTLAMFLGTLLRSPSRSRAEPDAPVTSRAATLLRDDRFWAGILCALAVLMHFYFY